MISASALLRLLFGSDPNPNTLGQPALCIFPLCREQTLDLPSPDIFGSLVIILHVILLWFFSRSFFSPSLPTFGFEVKPSITIGFWPILILYSGCYEKVDITPGIVLRFSPEYTVDLPIFYNSLNSSILRRNLNLIVLWSAWKGYTFITLYSRNHSSLSVGGCRTPFSEICAIIFVSCYSVLGSMALSFTNEIFQFADRKSFLRKTLNIKHMLVVLAGFG